MYSRFRPFFTTWSRELGLVLLSLCLAFSAQSQPLVAAPALTAHVMDSTGTLTPAQMGALESRLVALERSKGSQVVVLMLASTQPQDIASYANRVADTWKIGRKGVGDGLLLIVAKQDHRVRIEVARTLEGAVPDVLAGRIISEQITPRFKLGDYGGGLDAGVQSLSQLIQGEALPGVAPEHAGWTPGDTRSGSGSWTNLALLAIVLIPAISMGTRSLFGRGFGSLLTGGAVASLAFFVTTSFVVAALVGLGSLLFALLSGVGGAGRWRGGTWGGGSGGGLGGGGFGGGGFSSGGGGSFGGGGASGSW